MQTRTSTAIGSLPALLLLSFGSAAAGANWTPDPPLRTQTAKDARGDEITCTYYRDIFVHVTQTDTPSPGDATLIHTSRPPSACSAKTVVGTLLRTRGFSYVGRKGPYLFFEQADPNGATAFSVIDARTGRAVIEDSTQGGIAEQASFHSVLATPVTLTLAYRRAVNTTCSILATPAACWEAIIHDTHKAIPPAVARLAPPVRACARSYAGGKVGRSDPSVIAYEVRVTWTRGGGRQVQATGPVDCLPLP